MLEANGFSVTCPSCNAPQEVPLIQVATHQVITCPNCKHEIRLLDKDGQARRAISDTHSAWHTIR